MTIKKSNKPKKLKVKKRCKLENQPIEVLTKFCDQSKAKIYEKEVRLITDSSQKPTKLSIESGIISPLYYIL